MIRDEVIIRRMPYAPDPCLVVCISHILRGMVAAGDHRKYNATRVMRTAIRRAKLMDGRMDWSYIKGAKTDAED